MHITVKGQLEAIAIQGITGILSYDLLKVTQQYITIAWLNTEVKSKFPGKMKGFSINHVSLTLGDCLPCISDCFPCISELHLGLLCYTWGVPKMSIGS